MSTTQQDLILARLDLEAAEVEAKKEKRAKARRDLDTARAEARRLDTEIKAKVTEFHRAEAEAAQLQSEFQNVSSTIANLVVDQEFPTDEEIAEHEAVRAHLVAERDELLHKREAATRERENLRRDAIVQNEQLNRLRYQIGNLQQMARGGL